MKHIYWMLAALTLFVGCSKMSTSTYSIVLDQDYHDLLMERVEFQGDKFLKTDVFVYEYSQGHQISSHKFEEIQPGIAYKHNAMPESEYITVRVDYTRDQYQDFSSPFHETWYLPTSFLLQDGKATNITIDKDTQLAEEEPR